MGSGHAVSNVQAYSVNNAMLVRNVAVQSICWDITPFAILDNYSTIDCMMQNMSKCDV